MSIPHESRKLETGWAKEEKKSPLLAPFRWAGKLFGLGKKKAPEAPEPEVEPEPEPEEVDELSEDQIVPEEPEEVDELTEDQIVPEEEEGPETQRAHAV